MPEPTRISASMALDAIEELADKIDAIRYEERRLLNERDRLLQDAQASGIPYKTLGRRSRLGLKRLQAIMARPLDPEDQQ